MLLIPSIEVKDGKCTAGAETGLDPATLAARLIESGARRIQLVDLDAAAGRVTSAKAIAAAIAACDGVPVQLAGGVRDEDSVQRGLDAGAQFVVLDPKAAFVPHMVQDLCLEFPTHVLLALDARDGRLAVEGNWSKLHNHTALEVAQQFEREGIAGVIHVDRGADGKRGGPSVAATAAIARGLQVPVIAAGGLAAEDEIAALAPFADDGLQGALLAPALLGRAAELRALFAAA
jgi:phosphoribosylformimino-5-aminoimidazole carboxamide ribotide isomerase